MAIRKITIPAQTVPPLTQGGLWTPDWYQVQKFIEKLSPLSDQDFSAINSAIALKSDILRSINDQTGTTYTFVLADSGKYCRFTNASAITATVPPNASVAFSIGTQIDVIQGGAGKLTLAQGSGVTINSLASYKSLGGQYAGGTLIKTATNTWDLVGNLIP